MTGELRSWTWLVWAFGVALCLAAVAFLNEAGQSIYCQGALWFLMFVMVVQTKLAYSGYWRLVDADIFRTRREALTLSAEGQMAEAFAHMHPETAKLVLAYQRTVWLIDECDVNEVCEWYLKADPRINVRFVEWVLKNSNTYSIMPAHGRLNDNAFHWDRIVSDRLMYQAFCDVLVRRHMLTEASGNQPGLWIEPWTPERVGKRFGLTLFEEEANETVKSEQ